MHATHPHRPSMHRPLFIGIRAEAARGTHFITLVEVCPHEALRDVWEVPHLLDEERFRLGVHEVANVARGVQVVRLLP